ncbi:hypothetical protein FE257_007458 [Aspergillus nanangensis]|uniref:N-acetyltransferase domain-containing protein n=1 Tax=Aspergillus nanangensis TaxID=2582783 RepID=A0AAD4GVD2_ASPNN|nr:hypothetical protein FE257_007458 [Aspergillus nanangensis]
MANSATAMEDVTIAPATVEDVPTIQSMVHAAYSKYIERMGQPPAPMNANYHEILATHEVHVLKANGDTVGSIVLGTKGDSVQINNLVVGPTAQGRGYGRILMAHAEETARQRGCTALTLYTNVKMYENLALYRKMRFEEIDRRTEDGYERVFFRKEIK